MLMLSKVITRLSLVKLALDYQTILSDYRTDYRLAKTILDITICDSVRMRKPG